jgi:glycosyltransferase involved in cell wall biosynthesis
MMNLIQINAVPYGSTGSIVFSLADIMEHQGHQVLCTTGFTWKGCDRPDYVMTSGIVEKTVHTWLARITGKTGGFSTLATWRLLRRMDKMKPDLIHLHNLHGWFINLPMLFGYIKKHNIPVVWTLHDCWSFTGHCPHFAMAGCDRWKTGCGGCDKHYLYPQTFFDCSETNWRRKKKWFTGVKNLTIVTPSQWLAEQVRASFLGEYPVRVINNGIDLSVFKPDPDVKKNEKFTLLGVSYDWDNKKGLDVFLELAKRLDDRFRIVLVGTNDTVDKLLPENITSIHRTQNPGELAKLYAEADLLVNPTREDTYPTVNMEALACGTPVLTFRTGGSPEILDEHCGVVVPCGDVDAMEAAILRLAEQPIAPQPCLDRAKGFDKYERFQEYVRLYGEIVK